MTLIINPLTVRESLYTKGVSQIEFGETAGISRSTMYRACNEKPVSFESAYRIAGALGKEISEIVKGEKTESTNKGKG